MKTKLLLLSLVIFVCASSTKVFSQDIILLRTGDEIKAIVNEVGIDIIKYKKFENQNGPTYSLEKSKVFMIKYTNGTKDVFTEQKATNTVTTTPANTVVTSTQNQTQAQPASTINYGSASDIDGNVYKTVAIGQQTWMAENLKVTHYNNGDVIPNVKESSSWKLLKTGARCYYDNDSVNSGAYGAIYNWYSVWDSRKICPQGWHVPTDNDWNILISTLGGETIAGGRMKETGTTHWFAPNNGATNESGFSALGGGGRYNNGKFGLKGAYGGWITSPENVSYRVYFRTIDGTTTDIKNHTNGSKAGGGSVRCVKD